MNQNLAHESHGPDHQQVSESFTTNSESRVFKLYFEWLTKPWTKYCVIIFWATVLLLGLFFAPLLLQETQLTMNSPENTASYVAREKMRKSFKTLIGSNSILIFSQCTAESCINGSEGIEDMSDGGSGACNYKCIQKQLFSKYNEYKQKHNHLFYNFTDLYTSFN
ncbi:hypothetical protein RFI_18845, partial [Reticulomyxa filosa]